jgi:hypothetical protein
MKKSKLILSVSVGLLSLGVSCNAYSFMLMNPLSETLKTQTETADKIQEQTPKYSITLGADAVQGTSSDNSTASGKLGFSRLTGDSYFSVVFFNGSLSVVNADNAGESLSNPDNTQGLHVGYRSFKNNIYGDIGFTNISFEGNVDTNGSLAEHKSSGNVIFATVGYIGNLVPKTTYKLGAQENSLSCWWQVGVTVRNIGGNIVDDAEFRNQLFGTSSTFFPGVETIIFAELNNIRPYAKVSYFYSADTISDFSNIQASIGVELASSIFDF